MSNEEIAASAIERFKKENKRANFWFLLWCATAGMFAGTIIAMLATTI